MSFRSGEKPVEEEKKLIIYHDHRAVAVAKHHMKQKNKRPKRKQKTDHGLPPYQEQEAGQYGSRHLPPVASLLLVNS